MVVTMKQTAKATEATYMRKATLEDLDRIWEIVEDARALLKADGSEQWQNGYPTRLTFQQDIEFGNCYLMIAGDRIAGTVTLMPQGDTHYNYIVDGEWAMPGHPFATIHRIAIDSAYRGRHNWDHCDCRDRCHHFLRVPTTGDAGHYRLTGPAGGPGRSPVSTPVG